MGTSDLLATAERRAFVLKLRKAGATYREIAETTIQHFGKQRLKELSADGISWVERYGTDDQDQAIRLAADEVLPGGWCDRYAHKDVARELQHLREEINDDRRDILALELERLDDLLKGLWQEAVRKSPDHAAVDRVLKILERRAKLLGLDRPV
jgi:hypothetical protein